MNAHTNTRTHTHTHTRTQSSSTNTAPDVSTSHTCPHAACIHRLHTSSLHIHPRATYTHRKHAPIELKCKANHINAVDCQHVVTRPGATQDLPITSSLYQCLLNTLTLSFISLLTGERTFYGIWHVMLQLIHSISSLMVKSLILCRKESASACSI